MFYTRQLGNLTNWHLEGRQLVRFQFDNLASWQPRKLGNLAVLPASPPNGENIYSRGLRPLDGEMPKGIAPRCFPPGICLIHLNRVYWLSWINDA
jgi:hypothetical protein